MGAFQSLFGTPPWMKSSRFSFQVSHTPGVSLAAVAKAFVSEANVRTHLDAVQIHGGYGYMTETGLERALRDAVGGTIYSGTSEIQRRVIARGLGL